MAHDVDAKPAEAAMAGVAVRGDGGVGSFAEASVYRKLNETD